MSKKHVLIAGASGFVGGACMEYFSSRNWPTTGLSRRMPHTRIEGCANIQADLLNKSQCNKAIESLDQVTHLVYAAVNETPGSLVESWSDMEHIKRNATMFENLLDSLIESKHPLRHVGIVHGTKAYGKGPHQHKAVPWHEDLPRPASDDFYFHQEDYVQEKAEENDFCWTTYRAPMITGGGQGSNLNSFLAIAVLASMYREAGEQLPFPVSSDVVGVHEMVDVRHLAKAVEWGASAATARNQTFNIANGDVYTWPLLWPIIADEIGIEIGEYRAISVGNEVFSRADLWREMIEKYNLSVPEDLRDFLGESCALADFVFQISKENWLTSTVKVRKAGFTNCIDTRDCIRYWIRQWRDVGLIPPR